MLPVEHDSILRSEQNLERALADGVPGLERGWTVRVKLALLFMRKALLEHKAATEGLDGLFAAVVKMAPETMPTLDRRLGKLCEDHVQFLRQAQVLQEQVQNALDAFQSSVRQPAPAPAYPVPAQAEGVPDFGDIRSRGEQFLAALREHRETETRILLETVTTDVGVGD